MLSKIDQRLLNDFQRGLPLTPTPFADIARRIGVPESLVLASLQSMSRDRLISRVGAIFAPNTVGASLLAAICVPESRLDEVASWISSLPEVNHNYEREHEVNLWFVLTARDATRLENVIRSIEDRTGLAVMRLPLLDEFHIDLGFPLAFDAPP